MIVLDLSILNQKGTPMFNSDLTANRPAAGIVGRIFIAIDSPYGIFRDTGTAWDQISSAGGGATIYTGDGTLTGTRTISSGGFQLVINPQTTFFSSLTASTSASSFSVLGSNALTFAAGFSSSNIGNVYSANGAINAQNFLGNATFAQANLASAMVNVNKIDFGSAGHTITMTQSTAPGIRAMTGVQNQIQFTGSHNGTISHAAISQNLGFFRESGSTRTLTITNAYSHLINPLDDYGAGFTFTNRWGIYQAGASDKNYFAANSLFGSTTDTGEKVQITGTAKITGYSTLGGILLTGEIFGPSNTYFNGPTIGTGTIIFRYGQVNLPNTTINGTLNTGATTANTSLGVTNTTNPATFFIQKTSTSSVWYFENNRNAVAGSLEISNTISNPTLTFFPSRSIALGTYTETTSAIFAIESTTKGFRPPVMTNAQRTAITSPAVGLIVYCTDAVEGLYINKSTGWTFVI